MQWRERWSAGQRRQNMYIADVETNDYMESGVRSKLSSSSRRNSCRQDIINDKQLHAKPYQQEIAIDETENLPRDVLFTSLITGP